MTASVVSALGSSTRSLEWLGGPASLLSSTALTTGQLSSLGPIASLVEGAAGSAAQDSDPSLIPAALAATANQAVLQTHAQIEGAADQVAPLNGPLHGVTNLGETLGLGHIGESGNLLTDAGGVVANPGETGSILPLLGDTARLADAANALTDSVTAAPAAGNGLVGSGSVLAPAESLLNQAVLGTHASLEQTGHEVPILNAPLHAVTGLGETVGLGHLGEAGTLLTDVSTLPGALLNGGGLTSATPILSDLGHVLGAGDALTGALTGLTDGAGLLSSNGLLAPLTNLANTGVLDMHGALESIGHEIAPLNDTIHGLTGLGESIGLGHLGESGNLLTDTASLPGDLLSGHGTAALTPVLGDVGSVVTATGGLVDGVTGLTGGLSNGVGGAEAPVAGLLAPVTETVGSLLNGGGGTVVGGLLGGLNGGGDAGSHPLVEVGAGPSTATPVANLGVLTPEAGTPQAVQVNAVDVPAGQPGLLHASLLTGDSLVFPQTGGGGDSLVGQLHDVAPLAALGSADIGTSHDLIGDLGLASLELGGHAQASHADPTPHSATTGVHLLGL